jgi:nucleoid-associated protein EbfC
MLLSIFTFGYFRVRNYENSVYKVKSIYYIYTKIKIVFQKKSKIYRRKLMKGGMQGMLKQVQKMQAEMQKVQNELGNLTISEEAGGGMIKATANGNKEIISVEIDPQVIKAEEKEILEDLVVAAVNKALQSAGKMAEEEMAKVTKGMIPPGLNIPGL